MDRLSGDQKGFCASSVPASNCGTEESSERTNNCVLPSVKTVRASHCPSGEIEEGIPNCQGNIPLFGGYTRKRTAFAWVVPRRTNNAAKTIVVSNRSTAAIHGRYLRTLNLSIGNAVWTDVDEPDSDSSANTRSRAD